MKKLAHRVSGDKAFLTLKGENTGAARSEFEYEIPVNDANEMLAELCSGPIIEKTRYLVEHSAHTWEVDIFRGDNGVHSQKVGSLPDEHNFQTDYIYQ